MLCQNCGKPVGDGDRFCQNCGKTLQLENVDTAAVRASPAPDSPLTSLNHLLMLWDKFAFHLNYQFQDLSGMLLGETKGEMKFPLKYTLFDTNQQPVLIVDGVRTKGLLYSYLIHDAAGNILVSLNQKNSFMSRKYGITKDGIEVMLLTTDSAGANYKIEDANRGTVLASGYRHMALKTSKTEIDISETENVDHRIVLGGMILACYLSTRI